MTPIVTPTTSERILRTLGLTALCCVFSGWFLYDGYVGYPAQNLEKAVEALDPVPEQLPTIDPAITNAGVEPWLTDFRQERITRADILEHFGPPEWESPARDEIRYFGPGGVLRFSLSGDLLRDAAYVAGEKDDTELAWQRILGYLLVPVALAMILQLLRVLTTRVVLDDDGLKVRARALIPFDAMTGLDAARYRKKGYMDLSYTVDGKPRKVRLDDYIIRDFRPIVTEICERCGLENPLPPPQSEPGPAGPT